MCLARCSFDYLRTFLLIIEEINIETYFLSKGIVETSYLLISDWARPLFGIIVLIIIIGIVYMLWWSGKNPSPTYSDNARQPYTPVVRRGWAVEEKEQVRIRQDGKCAHCGKPPPRWDYHHADGDRSNNSMGNCLGLCPNCHSVETHEG